MVKRKHSRSGAGWVIAFLLAMVLGVVGGLVGMEKPTEGILIVLVGLLILVAMLIQSATGSTKAKRDTEPGRAEKPKTEPELEPAKPETAQYKIQVNPDKNFGSYYRGIYRHYSESYLATDKGMDKFISDLGDSVHVVLEDTPERLRRMIRRVNRPVQDDYIRSSLAKNPAVRDLIVRKEAWCLMTSDQRRSCLERASFIRIRYGRI